MSAATMPCRWLARRYKAVAGLVCVFIVLASLAKQHQAASLRESGDEMQKLMYKISRNPGKSLYRSAASPGCPELKAWDHKANAQVQDLLTPPEKISAWAPPKDDEALAALHRRRAAQLLKPWKRGIRKEHMVVPDHNDHVECEEPVIIKYKDGILYGSLPTHAASPIAGFDSSKLSFMNPRRRHTIDAVQRSINRIVDDGRKVSDFQIVACMGDGYLLKDDKVALGLAWGGPGTGTLPMSEQEWNWPGHTAWGQELDKTFAYRDGHPWDSRKNQVIFRGGIIDRACYPTQQQGGDEMGMADPDFAGEMCGRARLLKTAKCYPDVVDAAPTDHRMNFMSMADQEKYKYVLYVEGNYGWANRLKSLLAMKNVIIMQHNEQGAKEWYGVDLRPWVHYIPVDHHFYNIREVVAWARANDEMALRISQNADAYAESILSMPSFAMHLDIMLEEYAKLIKFEIEIDTRVDLPADILLNKNLMSSFMHYLNVVKRTILDY